MIAPDQPIRSVAVVGTPLAGCSAALAVRRALPDAQISFLALPDKRRAFVETLGAAGAGIAQFHEAIGIDHVKFARQIGALPERGTRLVDWPQPGQRFVVRRGQEAAFADGVALHQLWLKLDKDGEANLPPWDELGQDAAPSGMRFDPRRYHVALGELLGAAGIAVATPDMLTPHLDEAGGIAAVEAPGGLRYEADLFIDATGPDALLIGALGVPFEPWPELPALALTGIAPGKASGLPFQQIGPLGDAITVDNGLSALRFGPTDTAPPCGARTQTWQANVIAVGEAATQLPPMAGMPYDVLHHDLLQLMALLPSGTGPALRGEYQRRSRQMQLYWRDWAAAFWIHRSPGKPEGLAHVIDRFEGRGRLPVRDSDPVTRGEWIDLLIGMGVRPRQIDPTALAPSRAQALDALMRSGEDARARA